MESVPVMALSSLVEDIYVKAQEKFLEIDRALQTIQDELVN